MALVRWQPREVSGFGRDLDRFFDSFWGDAAPTPSAWYPSVDISESDEAIAVAAELPGMKPDDISVCVANGVLTIEGEKKEVKEEKEKQMHRVERTYGSFRRAFRLPTAVNAEKIAATYKDGVLRLSLPKAEAARTRQIEVKAS